MADNSTAYRNVREINAIRARPYQFSVLGFYELVLLISVVMLFVYRKRSVIKIRGIELIVLQASLTMVLTPAIVLQHSFPADYPCFIVFWSVDFGIGCWILVFLSRGFRFYNLYNFHKHTTAEYSNHTLPHNHKDQVSSPKLSKHHKLKSQSFDVPNTTPVSLESGMLHFEEGSWQFIRRSKVVDMHLKRGILGVIFAISVFCVIVQFTAPDIAFYPTLKRGEDCSFRNWVYWPTFVLLGIFSIILAPGMVIVLRKIKDTQGIQLDMFVTAICSSVCFIVYFLMVFKIIPEVISWSYIGPNHLIYLLMGPGHITSVILPLFAFFKTKAKPKLNMNMESFVNVLNDEDLFESLRAAAAKDLCSEQIIFLEEIALLKKRAEEPPTEERKKSVTKNSPYDQQNLSEQNLLAPELEELRGSSMSIKRERSDIGLDAPRRSRYDYNVKQQRTTIADPETNLKRHASESREKRQRSMHELAAYRARSVDSRAQPSVSKPLSSKSNLSPTSPTPSTSAKRPAVPQTQYDVQALKIHCGRVIEAFIRVGSPLELNISGSVRREILHNFKRQSISPLLFDKAREEVIHQLFLNTYPKMIKAQKP